MAQNKDIEIEILGRSIYYNNIYTVISEMFIQRYKKYKNKLLEEVFNKRVIKPWMSYKEIAIVEEILEKLQPIRCLEWGSGYSTLYFPRFLNQSAKWFSIEHDEDWAKKVRNMNQNLSVKIFFIKPNYYPWTDKYGDGAYSDLKEYVEFPSKFGEFDFILVDGKARKDCLIKANELVNNKGLVILHDANREYYYEPFELYKYQVLLQDIRKLADDSLERGGGIWIGSKEDVIKRVFDIDKHRKLWAIYNKLGKIIERWKVH